MRSNWSFWKHNAPNTHTHTHPVEVQCPHRKHCYLETPLWRHPTCRFSRTLPEVETSELKGAIRPFCASGSSGMLRMFRVPGIGCVTRAMFHESFLFPLVQHGKVWELPAPLRAPTARAIRPYDWSLTFQHSGCSSHQPCVICPCWINSWCSFSAHTGLKFRWWLLLGLGVVLSCVVTSSGRGPQTAYALWMFALSTDQECQSWFLGPCCNTEEQLRKSADIVAVRVEVVVTAA